MSDTKTNAKAKIVVPDDDQTIELPAGSLPGAGDRPSGHAVRIPDEAAVMPVINTVMFPGTVMPLTVGRQRSRRLLNEVLPDEKVIVLVTQRSNDVQEPEPGQLHQYGTAVLVLKLLRMEDGNQNIIVHGLVRVRIDEYTQTDPFYRAKITTLPDETEADTETEALVMNVRNSAQRIVQLSPNVPEEAQAVLESIDQPGALADFIASNLPIETDQKQQLLETLKVPHRLREVGRELSHQLEVLELSSKIQQQVRSNMDKTQREYYLQEQLKAIQKELGQGDERGAEVEQLRETLEKTPLPDNVRPEAERELDRLSRLPQTSPEYTVIRTYLEWMTELPWGKVTEDSLDINKAESILNADHHDLEKVKKRILEYLAVRKLAPQSRGPILCFAGPPGVGKTSLGQSIARALGREFIRMSLGGVHDEAELRGHRRTYIGALPGRIVQEIRKAGSMNPVFMLDEVDKLGADFRGDPTSALLEVLDPAQNHSFQDNYLNVPMDLSRVLFIATANYMGSVPPPLRDRMEIIELPGYTAEDKLQIAKKYLVPRQLKENGLKKSQLTIRVETLRKIIEEYTREAGVRELERQIGGICRAVAAKIARGAKGKRTVSARNVTDYLGPVQYQRETAQRTSVPGVATGLAFTPVGGEIIFVEATRFPGRGNLMLTGQIGDVMKESAQAAYSLIRSRAETYGLSEDDFKGNDVHIHVPAGAVPKDGPSAGVAMVTALASLLTDQPVRNDVAMTGEITLRGLVLPVGGIKQKVLAASAAGIDTVVLPHRNEKDLVELPPAVRKKMSFVFADKFEDVLAATMGNGRVGKTKSAGKKKAKKTAKRGKRKAAR